MIEPIFLLSAEEYEAYKDRIPLIPCVWWLGSQGYFDTDSSYVDHEGDIKFGAVVTSDRYAIRPAIVVRSDEGEIGNHIIKCGFPWIKIAPCMAIAEVPIAWRRFDTTSNDYRTSEIRQYLLDWYNERKEF